MHAVPECKLFSIRRRVGSLLIAGATLLAAGVSSAPALDFTLKTFIAEEDGYKHEHHSFRFDERTDVIIDLPRAWSFTASPNAIVANDPGSSGSVIRLEKSALNPNIPYKDKGLDVYRKRVLGDLPQGATNVQTEEHLNPLPIFKWTDFEMVVSYDFYGQSLRRSVVFVNLNTKDQIVETTTSPREGFDHVRDLGLDVLRSWQIVPAS